MIKLEFIERLIGRVNAMRIGDPMNPETQGGALISEEHMNKVLGYIARGRAEGARILTGGMRVTRGGLANGFFVAPTVFDNCRDDMAIVREEIFGPVMAGLQFSDREHFIAAANDTRSWFRPRVFT